MEAEREREEEYIKTDLEGQVRQGRASRLGPGEVMVIKCRNGVSVIMSCLQLYCHVIDKTEIRGMCSEVV